jgi:hypothetical protein
VAGGSREAAGKGAASRGHSVPREKGEEGKRGGRKGHAVV